MTSIASCGEDDAAPHEAGTQSTGFESTGFVITGVPDPRPNIVLITLDDLGWSSLPAYGNRHIDTPAIDALANGGVAFTHAFLVTSSCSPSRGVLLTGQYPHTHGLTGLVHRYPELAIPADRQTLPRLLADSGYTCAIQGKWHVSDLDPTRFGFHESLNDTTGTKTIDDAEVAVDFLRRHRSERFYLELDFVEPHLPWKQHDGLVVDPDAIGVLEHWVMPDWPEIRQLAAAYFSEILHVDRVLADVLQALDDLGLAANTLIALTSDNGAPFPGNKMTLYDRGIRAPLIVRWPTVVPAGVRSESLVSIVDLPQALVLATAHEPAGFMDGDPTFFELLRDPTRIYRDSVYAEMEYHAHYCPARAVRTERWKYIRNLSDDAWGLGDLEGEPWTEQLIAIPGHDWLDPRPPVELYDLSADPHELNNLADSAAHADILARLHDRLLDHAATTGDDEFDLDP